MLKNNKLGLEELKLSKSLHNAMQDAGLAQSREIQVKTISRIVGGQSFVAIAPSESGKTTAYILGTLMRFKYSLDEAPKVLILVKDQERGNQVIELFKTLAKNRGLRITGLFGTGGMENEISELMEGIDVVVATPSRARAVYLKLGLNMNRLQTFIIDDADELIAAGQQLPINELARSAGKCQYLVFTSVLTRKLSEQISSFLEDPTLIEVKEELNRDVALNNIQVFEALNFQTKINLLHYFLKEDSFSNKVVLYVNSRISARNLYKEVQHLNTVIFRPIDFQQQEIEDLEIFNEVEELNILIVAHESNPDYKILENLPSIHLEILDRPDVMSSILTLKEVPVNIQLYISDAELIHFKRLENTIGKNFEFQEVPDSLKSISNKSKKSINKNETEDSAFHKKKESNSKTFNYGIGDKRKMNKKKKYG